MTLREHSSAYRLHRGTARWVTPPSIFTVDKDKITIAILTGKARAILKQIDNKLDKNAHLDKKSLQSLKAILKHIDEADTVTLREMIELQNQNTAPRERVRWLEDHLEDTRQNYQQLIQKLPNTA